VKKPVPPQTKGRDQEQQTFPASKFLYGDPPGGLLGRCKSILPIGNLSMTVWWNRYSGGLPFRSSRGMPCPRVTKEAKPEGKETNMMPTILPEEGGSPPYGQKSPDKKKGV